MGTLINAAAILLGGLIGILLGSRIPDQVKDGLMKANGISVIFIGITGVIQKMLVIENNTVSLQGTMMMILSLAIGALLGEWWNIEAGFETFGEWLKKKTGNSKDSEFVNAFVNASLTVCIGAMAVIGSIQDGISNDPSILIAKAVLDFVIILVMSASSGKGCLFSFLPVAVFQGSMTLLAHFIAPYLLQTSMDNLSIVGSVLIFCVGINLAFGKKIRVANLLPALLIAVIWGYFQ